MEFKYWESLDKPAKRRFQKRDAADNRTEYEIDYTNVIRSSSFRRLQDKAQVFPLKRNDFVRTRLTHSLEVSTIASAFGKQIARKLFNNEQNTESIANDLSTILSTASLIHDIGNPPFGHYGEKIISDFFTRLDKEEGNLLSTLTPEQKFDLTHFDGNAQGLRIVTKLQFHQDDLGLNLSNHTLGAFMKYNASSNERIALSTQEKKAVPLSKRKLGYFQSEKNTFEWVKSNLGNIDFRHPLSYLLESSDDIAYLTSDFIDGFKKNAYTWTDFKELVKKAFGSDHKLVKAIDEQRDDLKKKFDSNKIYRPTLLKVLKPRFESIMFIEAMNNYIANHGQIISGNYTGELITQKKDSEASALHNFLKDEMGVGHIYKHEEVLQFEIVAHNVLNELLDLFVKATLSTNREDQRTFEGKIYSFISQDHKYVLNKWGNPSSCYEKLLLVTDFLSGMTDSYMIELHSKLNGYK